MKWATTHDPHFSSSPGQPDVYPSFGYRQGQESQVSLSYSYTVRGFLLVHEAGIVEPRSMAKQVDESPVGDSTSYEPSEARGRQVAVPVRTGDCNGTIALGDVREDITSLVPQAKIRGGFWGPELGLAIQGGSPWVAPLRSLHGVLNVTREDSVPAPWPPRTYGYYTIGEDTVSFLLTAAFDSRSQTLRWAELPP